MVVFDPRLPEYRADPHTVLRGLRDESPVHRSSLGYWVLTRYADVFKAFRDPQLGGGRSDDQLRSLVGEGAAFEYMLRRLSNYDAPQHTRLRALVTKAFTARRIGEMRPRIQAITEDLLDATRDLATFDAVAALAAPLPSAVIGDMLGVPSEDWHRLSGWTEDLQLALAPVVEPASLQAANSAAAHFAAYVGALVERRRARPGDDLLSELMAAADDGDKLNPDELIATVMFLFSAGHSTTRDLIGNGLLALMREPSLWAGLVSDPSLVTGAVEETLRYESPIAFVPRKARERLLIAEVRIEAGEQLYLSPLAANRDPAKFPDPDRFDPRRLPNEHVAFGGGHHYCLGATLARAEAKIALELLARRCPVLELAVESVEWRPTMSFRGLKALPVRAKW